jgi:CheY-like chemotaxis protein
MLSPDHDISLSGLRALVVEDEFIIALDIDRTLEGAGAGSRHVSTVGNALAVLDAVESGRDRIDVVVLDLKLNHESALPVAARLSKLGIPFAFLTGAPENGDTRAFPNAPVVAKPFDSASLLGAVCRALGRAGEPFVPDGRRHR